MLEGYGFSNASTGLASSVSEDRRSVVQTGPGSADLQQNTKQRIVGTVVLLACCLIFLPIVFDGEGSYEPALTSRIPDPRK